ncbi:MAG: hypothetical protein DCO81_06445 [Candidatus Aquiluna sp. XM-24bin5]|nr:MAG: hypothetical protein DCO81_06445 [Candidatus Aquiluna sp. XM-24bin5]
MYFLIVVLAYIFCHGVTSLLITPLQSYFLPNVTIFASFLYLPHGVRVLATWAYGWRAIPALLLGAGLSEVVFARARAFELLSPLFFESLLVGACCALVAFVAMRLLGRDMYLGRARGLQWRGVLSVGFLSSIVNSIGQGFVFDNIIQINDLPYILAVYTIGDVFGLVMCMFVLMLLFRQLR